jgi:hypothetical protein
MNDGLLLIILSNRIRKWQCGIKSNEILKYEQIYIQFIVSFQILQKKKKRIVVLLSKTVIDWMSDITGLNYLFISHIYSMKLVKWIVFVIWELIVVILECI